MSEPGASTSTSEASSDIDVEAATLLSQGRRNLLVGDPASAVQCLQEACELLGTKYGELANECGESYYYYGWALLELARVETGVLGNALDGVPEDDTEEEADVDVTAEEREKIFHDVQEALEDEKDEAKGQDSETDKENASEMDDAKTGSEQEPETAREGDKAADQPCPDDEKQKEEGNKDKEGAKDADKSGEKAMNVSDDDAGKTDSKTDTAEVDVAKKDEKGSHADDTEDKKEAKDKDKAGEKSMEVDDDAGKMDTKKDADEVDITKKDKKDEGAEPSDKPEGAEAGTADDEAGDGADDGVEGAEGETETKDEDVSNFELSWEMLELARVLFSQQEGEEFKLKVSQVYLKLGELGLERGNYPQSVDDFSQCLATQKELLQNDSRLLAETYYNLALAYSFDQKFDKAIENFDQSTVVIENRIAMLSKKLGTDKTASEEDIQQDQKEIKELQALIPEILAKIDDAKLEKNTAENAVGQAMRSAAAEFGLGSSSSGAFACCSSTTTAKPIAVRKPTDTKPDDISYLVHRKRKPEEDEEPATTGKRLRQEEGGGDAATANDANSATVNNVNSTNGVEQAAMNGDANQSPEKPEIKVKQVEQKANGSAETAAMET